MSAIHYSRGLGKYDNTPEQRTAGDFAEFRDAILADRAARKEGAPFVCGPLSIADDTEAHRTTGRTRSVSVVGKPYRSKSTALPRRFVGLDIDDERAKAVGRALTAESFAALVAHLHRYSGLVYTTASHTPQAPRCRIVLELDSPGGRDALIAATQAVQARIDVAMIAEGFAPLAWDGSCDKPEQPLFLPPVDAQVYALDGEPLRLVDLLAPRNAAQPPPQPAQETRPVPAAVQTDRYALAALESALRAIEAAPEGARNEVLNREAHGLGGFIGAGRLSHGVVESTLIDETRRAGWADPGKTEATIRGGIASGIAEPRSDGLATSRGDASNVVDMNGLIEAAKHRSAKTTAGAFTWGDALTSPAHLRPSEWTIRKVLPMECTGLLFGGWGTCKTFLAIDWAGCIANGIPWHGKPTRQGTVFYLAGEGEGGFARRLAAWEIANQASMAGLAFREMPEIRNPAELAAMIVEVEKLAAERGEPRLIVIDTLFTALDGGDENSGKDMGDVFKAMRALRQRFRCAVLAVHHTGHEGERARGHSSMPAGVDVQFFLKAKDAGDGVAALELANPKQKDGKKHPLIYLTTESIEIAGLVDEEGETESSLVIRAPALEMVAKLQEREEDRGAEAQALKDKAMELHGRGLGVRDIAKQVGRDFTTVSRWIKAAKDQAKDA